MVSKLLTVALTFVCLEKVVLSVLKIYVTDSFKTMIVVNDCV